MITLYSGTPGSGKSLKTAERIYNIMKYQSKLIIANFDCNVSKFKKTRSKFIYRDNSQINPAWLQDTAGEWYKSHKFSEDGVVLIIDECQLMFNARDWNKSGRGSWLSFFTLHRHIGINIILVAQFDRMIDRQIRSLIEYEYIHRKVSNFGWKGKLISMFAFGKMFVQVQMWYPLKEKVGVEFFVAKKAYYSMYDTYALFDEQAKNKKTKSVIPNPESEPEDQANNKVG